MHDIESIGINRHDGASHESTLDGDGYLHDRTFLLSSELSFLAQYQDAEPSVSTTKTKPQPQGQLVQMSS